MTMISMMARAYFGVCGGVGGGGGGGLYLASNLLHIQEYRLPCGIQIILYDFCFANWN